MHSKMGELDLIEHIRSGWGSPRRASSRHVALGIGDDCAILRPPRGHEILVTTDFTLEGRHFRRDWHSPESAGHRALARGLSDIAAMGGQPLAAFLSLALPAELLSTRSGKSWVERFFRGLRTLADRTGVPLAGGDTSQSPSAFILADIVLIGSAPTGQALRRSTAKPGDLLYVTGALGGAAAELESIATRKPRRTKSPLDHSAHPQLFPEPRVAIGQALLKKRLAHAAIDLSDGLSTDLTHLCHESSVGAELDASLLPIHPLATANRTSEQALALALNGGEDYELLFAASPTVRIPHKLCGTAITRIGKLVRTPAITLIDRDGHRDDLKPAGWEHFRTRQ